ncbi:long-chain fatty acid--CoA ligase [Actinophytocola xanthii]|uniref:Long-chain fatty acid--CoA ligase n=1 Tax=Actinophytocola xanthii TaxID=1912961 RepID=A0A1Q8BZ85_9PSEU|nr:long-chain fatty acid--CoA ligase [Actinophytocola xanthii]OLF07440.1 long-chain fatty acid--CoA ligase [Actinophytocola xanthii]
MLGLMQDRPLSLPMLIGRVEQMFPHKRIISAAVAGETTASWGEVCGRARALAEVLERLDVPEEARVGTFVWNNQRHVELYLAVPCTGRVLHTINHRLFSEQIRYIVNDAADDVLFVDRSILDTIWPMVDEFPTVRHIIVLDDGDQTPIPDDPRVLDYEELLAQARPRREDFVVGDEYRAAALCYTSGTTGNPKGVLYSHRSIVLHALLLTMTDTFALGERDVVMPIVPMFHVNAWGLPYAAMVCGADLVLPGPMTIPHALASQMARHRVTFSGAVATIWRGLLPLLEEYDLSALRQLVCGGGAVDEALSEAYQRILGVPMTNAWGMTETSPVVTVSRVATAHDHLTSDQQRRLVGTPGPAVPLTQLRIVDGTGAELPWDGATPGELQAAGATIASAYFGAQPAPEAFTADGWLRTGDVATIDRHGYVRIVDRSKDLVKSGGEWISSVDLENAIMAHPSVVEAAIVGVDDPKWGERPLAYVVPRPGEQVSGDDIREHLRGRVAQWWIPERVEFIGEIPKTATGKFSKQTLRARNHEHPGPRAD